MITGTVTDIQENWIEVSSTEEDGNRYVLHYNPAEVDEGIQLGDLVEVRVSKVSDDALAALAMKEIKKADDCVLIGGERFSISLYLALKKKPTSEWSKVDEEVLVMLERSRQAIISALSELGGIN